MLAGDIGPRSLTSAPDNLEQAAAYIEYIWKKQNLSVTRQEFQADALSAKPKISSDSLSFPSQTFTAKNIVTELRGKKNNEDIILVGAHYDSVYDCPGANDNGSGVAALLEISRVLSKDKFVPDRTIRFVAFTNEEPPFFRSKQMGSFQYAQKCHNEKQGIACMLCLETIGYYSDEPNSQRFPHRGFGMIFPKAGNFVSFIANMASSKQLSKCVGAFRTTTKFPSEGIAIPEIIPGVDFSDQQNFWEFGYPGIMVTDTAFYRYPHYHELTDTPDKINYETLARVVSGLVESVKALSKI